MTISGEIVNRLTPAAPADLLGHPQPGDFESVVQGIKPSSS